ncbi:MAG: hypothetical protein ACK5XN_07765 [Bacteroidota bacterium]
MAKSKSIDESRYATIDRAMRALAKSNRSASAELVKLRMLIRSANEMAIVANEIVERYHSRREGPTTIQLNKLARRVTDYAASADFSLDEGILNDERNFDREDGVGLVDRASSPIDIKQERSAVAIERRSGIDRVADSIPDSPSSHFAV